MEDILIKLQQTKPILESEFGITSLGLFGSYARNEQNNDSDIDIVILNMNRKNGLTIARAQRYLSELLHKNVDLGLYDSLRPYIKNQIDRDIKYV